MLTKSISNQEKVEESEETELELELYRFSSFLAPRPARNAAENAEVSKLGLRTRFLTFLVLSRSVSVSGVCSARKGKIRMNESIPEHDQSTILHTLSSCHHHHHHQQPKQFICTRSRTVTCGLHSSWITGQASTDNFCERTHIHLTSHHGLAILFKQIGGCLLLVCARAAACI